jgi:hypothetical protein
VRIRNLSVAATDDVFNASFYVDFNRAISEVSARTGMPVMVISTALASASAKANPYTELLRLLRVAGEVRVANGRAYAPSMKEVQARGRGNSVFWPATSDNPNNFLVTTAQGLADAINNPNFLDAKVSGIAAKTLPYAYLRYDPMYWLAYVADTVDGLGQFMFRGSSIATDDGISAIQNQLAGRILANIYGVKPSDMQEALWAYVRIMRDAFGSPLEYGGFRATAIAPAFRGSAGDAVTVLNNAIDSMDPRLIELARSNYEQKFVPDVRAGKARGWEWDGEKPVIASEEFLIPPENRKTPRAQKIQRASLELVEAAGETLKARLLSLAAAAGISADVLIRSAGDVLSNLPLGARVGAGAGALLGATQSSAAANDGSVTLGAAPIAGAGAGALAGAALGGGFGVVASMALRASKSARGLARRVRVSPDVQVSMQIEDDVVQEAFDFSRQNFLYRILGQTPDAAKTGEILTSLADAPVGRLYADLRDSLGAIENYLMGAANLPRPAQMRISTAIRDIWDVAIPGDLFDSGGSSFGSFIDGFLVRAFNGGRGGNVVYNAMSDGTVSNGGALRGKYVVSVVSEDLIEPKFLSYKDEEIMWVTGRRKFLAEFQRNFADLGAAIQDEPRGVFYAFNTGEPSYLGSFEFKRSNIFGNETVEPWSAAAPVGPNDARELVIMPGTLVDSEDEAFRIATQRGQLFVKNALTGENVRVPDNYVGETVKLDRVTIPPSPRTRNVAAEIDPALDAEASTFYSGRGNRDSALEEIYKAQGFDRPTILVNDAEAEILIREHGFMPLYRGVEFEPMIEARVPQIADEIRNSPVWKNEIEPRLRNEAEAADLIRGIAAAREQYLYKVQDSAMSVWVGQQNPLLVNYGVERLVWDVLNMVSYHPPTRSAHAYEDFASRIWPKLAVSDLGNPDRVFRDVIMPDRVVRDFAVGNYYPGSGSHGSGTYTTPNLQRAMGYAGINGDFVDLESARRGTVLGMLLKPDARIMGPSEYKQFVKAIRTWPGLLAFEDSLPKTPWGDDFTKLFNVLRDEPSTEEYVLRGSFSDIGRAIAAMGYDGYIPHGSVYDYQKPEYVLLNRQSFVVINHPIEPITVQSGVDPEAFAGYPTVEVTQ